MSDAPYPYDELVAGKAWDSSLLRRLMRYARPHRRLFLGSFAVLLGLFALELVGPWMWRSALDGPVAAARALELAGDAAAPDRAPYLRAFGLWIGAYFAVVLLSLAFRYWEVAQLARTGQAVVTDLRRAVFAHMQKLDLAWFDRRPTGALVTRVTTDVENLSELFTSGLIVLIFDAVKVLVVLAILFTLNATLAWVVLAGIPFLVGTSLVFRGGARAAHREVRARLAKKNGYLQEVLQGIRVVQVFGREKRVSGRFGSLLDDYLRSNVRTILLFALFFPTIDLFVSMIQGTTLWAGGLSIVQGDLSHGQFLQFWFYLALLVSPIRELGERYNVLQSAFASAERLFQVVDTKPTLRVPQPSMAPEAVREPLHEIRGHVVFEHVSFSYPGGSEVVSDVSFEIRPGETIAVVGATGAGKSTLVNLLLRFYDPTHGRILVDGVDLREWDLRRLRTRLGLVLQEDFLFAGTVHENLVLEREEVTDEGLELALRASRADELIARLDAGLHSEVAERGATFSTGERQLLAMARALAGDPRLVILDEATASIDSTTEAKIEAATRNLLRGRSALVVAHRLSTVRRADQILVMHRGKLRERGTHAELLAHAGLYARLHALQFGTEDERAPAV